MPNPQQDAIHYLERHGWHAFSAKWEATSPTSVYDEGGRVPTYVGMSCGPYLCHVGRQTTTFWRKEVEESFCKNRHLYNPGLRRQDFGDEVPTATYTVMARVLTALQQSQAQQSQADADAPAIVTSKEA